MSGKVFMGCATLLVAGCHPGGGQGQQEGSTESSQLQTGPRDEWVSLQDSVTPLKDYFNHSGHKLRFVNEQAADVGVIEGEEVGVGMDEHIGVHLQPGARFNRPGAEAAVHLGFHQEHFFALLSVVMRYRE